MNNNNSILFYKNIKHNMCSGYSLAIIKLALGPSNGLATILKYIIFDGHYKTKRNIDTNAKYWALYTISRALSFSLPTAISSSALYWLCTYLMPAIATSISSKSGGYITSVIAVCFIHSWFGGKNSGLTGNIPALLVSYLAAIHLIPFLNEQFNVIHPNLTSYKALIQIATLFCFEGAIEGGYYYIAKLDNGIRYSNSCSLFDLEEVQYKSMSDDYLGSNNYTTQEPLCFNTKFAGYNFAYALRVQEMLGLEPLIEEKKAAMLRPFFM